LTQELQKWDNNLNVKLLCYHSRFLQETKDQMEQFLTKQLNRKNPEKFYTGEPTVYIVVATPVVEVGRDFDFDWAIIEPSSERSIVQTAGRVLRHRSVVPKEDNIHILPYPFKYYRNQKVCYDTAGYESKGYPLNSKNMLDIYEQNSIVNSVNRLKGEVGHWKKSLVKLEHKVLTDSLTCVESDTNVFTGGWSLTGNTHHFCKWRRGVKQKVVDIVQGEWQDTQVVTKNYSSSKIWRKWDSRNGQISFPEYLQDKTIGYNEFYGGYEVED
jgi:CRISPR-associated endonuclease/helicase Cas3